MIKVKVTIPNSTKVFLVGLENRIKLGAKYGLENSRTDTVNSIKQFVPVVTGNLQRSIKSYLFENTIKDKIIAYFYSFVDYATIIDEGLYDPKTKRKYRKRDYLQKGITKELPYIVSRIEDSIIKEFNK
jgi:hypothetical protein